MLSWLANANIGIIHAIRDMGGIRIKLFSEEHTHFYQLSLVDSIHFIRSFTNDNDTRPFKMENLDINTLNGSTSGEEVCSFASIQAGGWQDGWLNGY